MKKLLLGLFVCLFLVACGGEAEVAEQAEAPSGTPEAVIAEAAEPDEVDEVVEVRVVAGSVASTNVLGELNALVIGIPTTDSQIPNQFADLPDVGISHTPDLEIVAALEPDLFIMDANFREANAETLIELGINTFFFETGTFSAFLESIALLGEAINRVDEARELIASLEASVDEALVNQGELSPTVAIIFGAGDNFMLATESSYLGDIARIMGASNIAAELEGGLEMAFLQFSLEQILVADPDYILRFAHGAIEQTTEMFNQMFDENDAFLQLTAVREGRVYDLDPTIFGVSANLGAPAAFRELGNIFYGE